MAFLSTKQFSGFSTCFRQWRATHSHCSLLHGYSVYFTATFTANELDDCNWVADFGGFDEIKTWLKYWFDHTVVLAQDDPFLDTYKNLPGIDLRVVPHVGCERFAEFVCEHIDKWISEKSEGRVRVSSVECHEHETNSAIFINTL